MFKGESFDWMDDFKSYICNSTVDVLSRFIDTYSIEDEADRVIQIADQILLNDPVTRRLCSIRSKPWFTRTTLNWPVMCTTAFALYTKRCMARLSSSLSRSYRLRWWVSNLPSKYYSMPAHWHACAIAIVTPVPSLWQDRATVMACLCHPCGTPLPLQWQMYAPHW